jgi:hypothetical protein
MTVYFANNGYIINLFVVVESSPKFNFGYLFQKYISVERPDPKSLFNFS